MCLSVPKRMAERMNLLCLILELFLLCWRKSTGNLQKHFMVKAMSSCRSMFPCHPIHRSALQPSGDRNSPANHPRRCSSSVPRHGIAFCWLVESTGETSTALMCVAVFVTTLRWAINFNKPTVKLCGHHLMVFLQRLRNSRESPFLPCPLSEGLSKSDAIQRLADSFGGLAQKKSTY